MRLAIANLFLSSRQPKTVSFDDVKGALILKANLKFCLGRFMHTSSSFPFFHISNLAAQTASLLSFLFCFLDRPPTIHSPLRYTLRCQSLFMQSLYLRSPYLISLFSLHFIDNCPVRAILSTSFCSNIACPDPPHLFSQALSLTASCCQTLGRYLTAHVGKTFGVT